jgi:hypothetical protein
VGGEGFAGFGDEFVEEVGAAGFGQLFDLLTVDGLLQDGLRYFKLAGFFVGLGFLADVLGLGFEDTASADGAGRNRLGFAEIQFWRRLFGFVLVPGGFFGGPWFEFEADFAIRFQYEEGFEWAAFF